VFHLDLRDHCHVSMSLTFVDGFQRATTCAPAVLWFTVIAFLHTIWITCLCISILSQVGHPYRFVYRMYMIHEFYVDFFRFHDQ
jgi:hypothetical protein